MTDKREILHMRMDAEHLQMLDRIRKSEDDLPTRTEMVRRLIERAVSDREARETKSKK